jgi:hypothetical protein
VPADRCCAALKMPMMASLVMPMLGTLESPTGGAGGAFVGEVNRWYREGKLPVPARRAGHLILVDPVPEPTASGRVVAYARVSSADQRNDLERQAGRVVSGATERGLSVEPGGD